MITEDYCSQEVFQLLREKGFPVGVGSWSKGFVWDGEGYVPGLVKHENSITHQTAMKWLREEHKISIEIYCIPSYTEGLVVWRYMIRNCETCDEVDYPNGYPAQECITFEESVEAALKYVLENLI